MSGNPAAAAAIWNWREGTGGGPRAAAANRRAGLVRGAVGGAIGVLALLFWHAWIAWIAFAVSGLTVTLALVSPTRGYAALEGLLRRFGNLVGLVVTFLTLAPIYYLFFAPFHILFRRGARDGLDRALDRSARSYWMEHEDRSGKPDRYRQQY